MKSKWKSSLENFSTATKTELVGANMKATTSYTRQELIRLIEGNVSYFVGHGVTCDVRSRPKPLLEQIYLRTLMLRKLHWLSEQLKDEAQGAHGVEYQKCRRAALCVRDRLLAKCDNKEWEERFLTLDKREVIVLTEERYAKHFSKTRLKS